MQHLQRKKYGETHLICLISAPAFLWQDMPVGRSVRQNKWLSLSISLLAQGCNVGLWALFHDKRCDDELFSSTHFYRQKLVSLVFPLKNDGSDLLRSEPRFFILSFADVRSSLYLISAVTTTSAHTTSQCLPDKCSDDKDPHQEKRSHPRDTRRHYTDNLKRTEGMADCWKETLRSISIFLQDWFSINPTRF